MTEKAIDGRRRSAGEVFTEGDLICFRIGASHFLWKMVRRIVGMLAEVGRSNLTYDAFERLLKFESDVPARFTAPPSGLFWKGRIRKKAGRIGRPAFEEVAADAEYGILAELENSALV